MANVAPLYVATAAACLAAIVNAAMAAAKMRRVLRFLAWRRPYLHYRGRAARAEARVFELEAEMADRVAAVETRWVMRQQHLQDAGGRLAGMLTAARLQVADLQVELRKRDEQLQAAQHDWQRLQRERLGLVASHG